MTVNQDQLACRRGVWSRQMRRINICCGFAIIRARLVSLTTGIRFHRRAKGKRFVFSPSLAPRFRRNAVNDEKLEWMLRYGVHSLLHLESCLRQNRNICCATRGDFSLRYKEMRCGGERPDADDHNDTSASRGNLFHGRLLLRLSNSWRLLASI